MNEVIRSMELSGNLSEEQNEALNLHYEIIAKGNLAASAMVDFCQNLKRMRDERKYLLLGHETFEEYVEQDVGIKQRQAYTYISALESLGEKYLQSNANLGISKLGMLAALVRAQGGRGEQRCRRDVNPRAERRYQSATRGAGAVDAYDRRARRACKK